MNVQGCRFFFFFSDLPSSWPTSCDAFASLTILDCQLHSTFDFPLKNKTASPDHGMIEVMLIQGIEIGFDQFCSLLCGE